MQAIPEYAWERFFKQPQEQLWALWTHPELFPQWYGPNVETIVHAMDVKEGGVALIEMRWGDNSSQFQKFEYRKVEPNHFVSWIQSTTDSDWNTIPHPSLPLWPEKLLTGVKLEKEGGANCVHFTWSPFGNVTQETIDFFKSAKLEVDAVWKANMDLYQELLESL